MRKVIEINEISKLDLMKLSKARYKYVQDNASKLVKDKIDLAITNSLILRWIKGRNWEGGLGSGKDVDKMFIKLQNDYGLGDDDLGDRFTRLCDFWEDQFKKAKVDEARKVIEATEPKRSLSKMNTNELRDYAVSLGADKKDLYGTSKQSLIILINQIEKGIKSETYSIVRIVDVGDFSSDKMEVGELKGTILDIKKKAQQKYGKVKSINHTTKEIIIENTVSENYVNEGKVTVEKFKKWLKDQVDDNNTPKDIKNFIEKQLDEIENVKKKFGDEKERKMCQRLADDIWELDLEVVIK
jgi:hypothetical protein